MHSPKEWHNFVRGMRAKRSKAISAYAVRFDVPSEKAWGKFQGSCNIVAIDIERAVSSSEARSCVAWHILVGSTPDPMRDVNLDFTGEHAVYSISALYDRIIAGTEPHFAPMAMRPTPVQAFVQAKHER